MTEVFVKQPLALPGSANYFEQTNGNRRTLQLIIWIGLKANSVKKNTFTSLMGISRAENTKWKWKKKKTAHCTLYLSICTISILHCSDHSAYCTLHTTHCTLNHFQHVCSFDWGAELVRAGVWERKSCLREDIKQKKRINYGFLP